VLIDSHIGCSGKDFRGGEIKPPQPGWAKVAIVQQQIDYNRRALQPRKNKDDKNDKLLKKTPKRKEIKQIQAVTNETLT
jgi:hypothetical protein